MSAVRLEFRCSPMRVLACLHAVTSVHAHWSMAIITLPLLHSQRNVINLLHLFSKWSFQVSFLSRMTPRYLACLEISRRCPYSFSVIVVLHLCRLLKMTTSVLHGFAESPVVRHQVSTIFNVYWITPISASKCILRTMTRTLTQRPLEG